MVWFGIMPEATGVSAQISETVPEFAVAGCKNATEVLVAILDHCMY